MCFLSKNLDLILRYKQLIQQRYKETKMYLPQVLCKKANQKPVITGSIIASAAAKFNGAPVITKVHAIAIKICPTV